MLGIMEQKRATYVCPMHPEVRKEKPGICPQCGMNLVPTFSKATPEKHAGHRAGNFLKKFWISAILTIPVLLYSDLPQVFFGWTAPSFPGSRYLSLILGSIVFFYGGWIFLRGAALELRARMPGMMMLIGLAITAAYAYSVYAVVFTVGQGLFWELTSLIAVMLLGHWMEMRAVGRTQGALGELAKLLPDTAEVIRGGAKVTVPLSNIEEGDHVFVRPGGKIPTDGFVDEGTSDVNESMISGESRPVSKTKGSEVIAGTINGDGALTITVTKIGERTFLAGIMRLVAEAQASKSRLQILSDRAAFYLTIIAIGGGGGTLMAWLFAGAGFGFAMERLIAVLVIACPHALGLAVPLVASISTTLAARNGFLVRERLALESARNIDIVLFDKTGTLTSGTYGVTDIVQSKETGGTVDDLLRLAASADAPSEHFIARAIVREAEQKTLPLFSVSNFQRMGGKGSRATIEGKEIFVGGQAMLEEIGAELDRETAKRAEERAREGKTIIFVISGRKLLGFLALSDEIRGESREAVQALKRMGIHVAMVTGDSQEVAEWVAKELGIEEYFARVLPQEKAEKVKLLQSRGKKVAMVGDGINDALALTQSDVGIAIGAGTNVAIESAGIILMRNDPRDIAKVISLSRATYTKMLQNLFWATGYNVVALPLAAGALAAYGILLQPAISAIFMSASTVIVSINAAFLARKKLS